MKIECRGWSRWIHTHVLFDEELSPENVIYEDRRHSRPYPYYFEKMMVIPSSTSDTVRLGFGGRINDSKYFFKMDFSLSELLPYIGKSIRHLPFDQIIDSADDSKEVFDYFNLPTDETEEDKEIECAWCYASESSVKKMFHDNTDVYICNDCIASAATKLLVDD
jgi:hypothetical protein